MQLDNVECSANACTVTFDRGVEAKSSVLGVDIKLVGVDNGVVKVDVGGTTVSVPVEQAPRRPRASTSPCRR